MRIGEATEKLRTLVEECRKLTGSITNLPVGDFEYESASAALLEVVLLHAEAFCVLARADERYFVSAAGSARSAMETAATIAWICAPKDKLEKEGRWLGYFLTLHKFYDALSNSLEEIDPGITNDAEQLKALHSVIRDRKIDGKEIPITNKPSSFDALLKSIGHGAYYVAYRELCQMTHVAPEMVNRFREGVDLGEGTWEFRIKFRTLGNEWNISFQVIGWALALATMATLNELGVPSEGFRPIHNAQVALVKCIWKVHT